MAKLTTTDMYELCNKYQWFTCGTNTQYEKMFAFVREANIDSLMIDYKIKELARMIWLCSDDEITFADIYNAIRRKLADKNGFNLRRDEAMKYKHYVGIVGGPSVCANIKYVTGIKRCGYALWEAGKPAKAFTVRSADDLAAGLNANGYPAIIVKMPDFYAPCNEEVIV